ncbi:MAG: hypothetical protein K2K36_08745, partial [Muribaculaceae bacterium]|nr:hypothetical protein [Muribaculaceae bacterium]
MANDNNEPMNIPGGETLNDRLKRAAAMAREHREGASHRPSGQTEGQSPVSESYLYGPERRQEPSRQPERQQEPVTPREPRRNPDDERAQAPRRREPERAHRRGEEYGPDRTPRHDTRKSRKWLVILAVLLGLAVLAVAFLTVSNTRKQSEYQQQVEQLQLANEQLQLSNEYDALNNEFAQYENQTSLLANDSIVQKYSAARAQVEKLLQELKNEKNKSAAQIGKLKDEITTLKGILRNYVEQINALNQENQELRTENQEVKARNQQLSANIQSVQQSNKELNERMTLAEKLNVTGVNLVPLNKKGKKEKNVTKARQLMVTFTIP